VREGVEVNPVPAAGKTDAAPAAEVEKTKP